MKALIVGAGIGGLTTALQLHKVGIEVEVFDSVSVLKELGVGINLQPHATRELAKLDLIEPLQQVSVLTSTLEFRSKDDKIILHEPLGLNAGYHYPQFSTHRGKLHRVLLEAFNKNIGTTYLHLSHRFKNFLQENNKVVAKFVNSSTQSEATFSGDLLIGADGIHSMVRKQLHPHEGPMHFEGIMMWRGTTYAIPPLDGATISVFGNPAIQLVVYPISNSDSKGMALINWVVEIQVPDKTKFQKEDWSRVGHLEDFIKYFSDWDLGFVDINHLFNNAESILEYPMVDRDPLFYWGQDRVTLLGDAAHPMYPRGANGAAQAIVDTAVLVEMLQEYNDIPSALKAYEAMRIPTTSQVIHNNRQAGQKNLFELIEKNCKGQCSDVHTCVEESVLKKVRQDYKKQAGSTVEQVNN